MSVYRELKKRFRRCGKSHLRCREMWFWNCINGLNSGQGSEWDYGGELRNEVFVGHDNSSLVHWHLPEWISDKNVEDPKFALFGRRGDKNWKIFTVIKNISEFFLSKTIFLNFFPFQIQTFFNSNIILSIKNSISSFLGVSYLHLLHSIGSWSKTWEMFDFYLKIKNYVKIGQLLWLGAKFSRIWGNAGFFDDDSSYT